MCWMFFLYTAFNIFLCDPITSVEVFRLLGCPLDDAAFQDFVQTGIRIAKSSEIMLSIEEDVANHIKVHCNKSNPSLFFYVVGSSGVGKTQLAFSFKRKVLYIPFGNLCYQFIIT